MLYRHVVGFRVLETRWNVHHSPAFECGYLRAGSLDGIRVEEFLQAVIVEFLRMLYRITSDLGCQNAHKVREWLAFNSNVLRVRYVQL